jgi:hypothetical protein
MRDRSGSFLASATTQQEPAADLKATKDANTSITQRRRRETKLAHPEGERSEAGRVGTHPVEREPRRGGTKYSLLGPALFLFGCLLTIQAQSSTPLADPAFTDRTASTLLRQLSESLQGHSQKKFLALFDLENMKSGPLFKQQIASFFSQTESIAIHLNLAETNPGNTTMVVDAEMEVQPRVGGQASRRNERLTFTIARSGKDWKFVDLQPRSFFSLP